MKYQDAPVNSVYNIANQHLNPSSMQVKEQKVKFSILYIVKIKS